jgi:hypothetical protein
LPTSRAAIRPPAGSFGGQALFYGGVADRFLQLFEGADFDLADPLAADAVDLAQLLQGGDCRA